MKRDLFNHLLKWKTSPIRCPLILRGARQVGKSWLIDDFSQNFDHTVKINFEKEPEASVIFDGSLDPKNILTRIQAFTGSKAIIPGTTLLFLDEIQECENAITALRYFKEEMPDLHVIAAGSLIDFALNKISIPVGRIEYLHLYPLSFGEFLVANDKSHLRDALLDNIDRNLIHSQLTEQIKLYYCLGGMPAVIQTWIDHHDLSLCQAMQRRIIQAYKQDFTKYSSKRQIPHVEKVFDAIPHQLGKKFIYSHIDNNATNYSLKQALELLSTAGVAHYCYHTDAQGLPLGATTNNKKFKIFFFDIGLSQALLNLDLKQWLTSPVNSQHLGSITEQLVAQEYIAYSNPSEESKLYYWHRESKSSNAEIDFVFLKQNQIIPVEVKSGKSGRMKSLQIFLDAHPNSPYALKITPDFGNNAQEKRQDIALYELESWVVN